MRRRSARLLFGLGLGLVACGAGCAAFTGLTGYSQGLLEDGSAESGGGTPSADEAAVLPTPDASEPDVPSAPIADASLTAPPPDDAASDVHVDADAAAICHAQCSGCCDSSGACHGGLSTTTCGAQGASCRDCSASGLACGSGARCVAAPGDAGGTAPMCVVTRCTNTCPTLPLLEAPCCKPDQTCGCGAVLGILLCN
ncbi:MAG: hypothetical protein ACRENE_21505 [Polyangiaceae bacterium]